MQIEVKNLTKKFKTKGKRKKLLFHESKEFIAVNNISFEIKKGDIVGFIGPNGAGKSTTIKMLTGIISKTSGNIRINGLDPFADRKQLTYKIGCMFGQKSQLYMHLSVKDSFYLIGSIYDIPKSDLNNRISYISKLFKIEEFLDKTVRKLSLGQRMICEIAACMIHKPEIIFLDEPTIGLDVIAKLRVREIIKKLNESGVTIILTSHDVADVSTLCNNIIVINKGQIIENTTIDNIKRNYLSKKRITFYYSSKIENISFNYNATISNDNELYVEIDTKKDNVSDVINYFTSIADVSDINITSTSMEEIIKNIIRGNCNMSKFFRILLFNLKVETKFKVDYFIRLFMYCFHIFVFNELWDYLLKDKLILGYDRKNLIWYIIIGEAIIYSMSKNYIKISNMVKTGDIANILVKPINILEYLFLMEITSIINLILNLIFAIIFGTLLLGVLNISLINIFIFIISILLSYFMILSIQILVGTLSFFFEESDPFYLIISKAILIITMTPLEFYSGFAYRLMSFLPTTYIIYAPAKIFLNCSTDITVLLLIKQIFSFAFILMGLISLTKKGVKKINVNGG